MKLSHLKAVPNSIADISLQSTSLDIWDRKYRLRSKDGAAVDQVIDDTLKRVARALADVETQAEKREEWFEKFLWALRCGAIPAGRIISNAGAQHYKPATSTINCTVSGIINDAMDDILQKLHEAGLTLKAGCGIGYCFSTLRPKGAYVSGSGAQTSGPLSFMDIYDKMCFTISSAGGRRGAQMATFDISHPDILDFIRVKREAGRLRQFNLSLLITKEFMDAVAHDQLWSLFFPVLKNEEVPPEELIWTYWPTNDNYLLDEQGRVACKIYQSIAARELWDLIMKSTYDYAEPGFILIDQYNEMNNNWWQENIRATNPCVTADTWVHTTQGPRKVGTILGEPVEVLVDGATYLSSAEGFFKTATKNVVKLSTKEGFVLRLTSDHRVRKVTRLDRECLQTEWVAASELVPGDQVMLHNHRQQNSWAGPYTENQGYLIGLLIGDGTLKTDQAVLSVWKSAQVSNGEIFNDGVKAVMEKVLSATAEFFTRADFTGWHEISGRNEYRLSFSGLKKLADELGLSPGNKQITSQIEMASSNFYRGFLQGFFDADGSVQGNQNKGVSVRLSQSDLMRLKAVQRMLLRLGINSSIYCNRRVAGTAMLPNSQRELSEYVIKPQHELLITGDNLALFQSVVGFTDSNKSAKLQFSLKSYQRSLNRERFVATIESVLADGYEDVYDIQVPGIHSFDANGLHVHNCGEQGLPPYGSCLLGSINLTKFVENPFTERAVFDFDKFKKVVAIFTRMLDNVVEINGLPLAQQRAEIISKRRHGMGFMGLGSALILLRIKYGSPESIKFTEQITREMALIGWQVGLELAKEKAPAPIMEEDFIVTNEMLINRPEMLNDGYQLGDKIKGKVLFARYSRYLQKIKEIDSELITNIEKYGCRFTHHTSIAPTGTIALSLGNNVSNGIEPSYAHHYSRNIIIEGKKSKEKVAIYSYELLFYRKLIDPHALDNLPDYFVTANDITPQEHINIQAAAQTWIDSSISKTINVPADFPFEAFKDIYFYAYQKGLKGLTTFRYNPENFQGVLVQDKDLESTNYQFILEDGTVIEAKGNDTIEYDGEIHTAANLYDALKEGYYGKF